MFSLFKFIKNILFAIPILYIFKPLNSFFHFISHYIFLLDWIFKNKKNVEYSDFFSLKRDYDKRLQLYDFVSNKYGLKTETITYLEFGVASGNSFNFWMKENINTESTFFGFDTFEGLPESWGGFFDKGDLSYNVPTLIDSRGRFIKGLFQDSLQGFINKHRVELQTQKQLIIHLDADLYTATLFALSQLYPFLKKGDLIFFDEFNVPLHEFKAFKEFTECFYIKLKPIGAVNNFYQTAFIVE